MKDSNNEVDVRMAIDIMSTFHGLDGVKRGQIVSLPETDALRYEFFGYCEPVGAEDESPRERKDRVDRTTAAVQEWMSAQAAAIERARHQANTGTIDTGTGKAVSRR